MKECIEWRCKELSIFRKAGVCVFIGGVCLRTQEAWWCHLLITAADDNGQTWLDVGRIPLKTTNKHTKP